MDWNKLDLDEILRNARWGSGSRPPAPPRHRHSYRPFRDLFPQLPSPPSPSPPPSPPPAPVGRSVREEDLTSEVPHSGHRMPPGPARYSRGRSLHLNWTGRGLYTPRRGRGVYASWSKFGIRGRMGRGLHAPYRGGRVVGTRWGQGDRDVKAPSGDPGLERLQGGAEGKYAMVPTPKVVKVKMPPPGHKQIPFGVTPLFGVPTEGQEKFVQRFIHYGPEIRSSEELQMRPPPRGARGGEEEDPLDHLQNYSVALELWAKERDRLEEALHELMDASEKAREDRDTLMRYFWAAPTDKAELTGKFLDLIVPEVERLQNVVRDARSELHMHERMEPASLEEFVKLWNANAGEHFLVSPFPVPYKTVAPLNRNPKEPVPPCRHESCDLLACPTLLARYPAPT